MGLDNFIHPLCLSCEVPLEEKTELDNNDGLIYQISYCPNCQEVYHRANNKNE